MGNIHGNLLLANTEIANEFKKRFVDFGKELAKK